MKKIEKWEAVDGTIFKTEEECRKYEQTSKKVQALNRLAKYAKDVDSIIDVFKEINNYCSNEVSDCDDCIFFCPSEVCMLKETPNEWDISRISKFFSNLKNSTDIDGNDNTYNIV